MRAPMIVLVLPPPQFDRELGHGAKGGPAVELVFIGPVAPLDLAVALGAPRGNVAMGDAEIAEVPGEVRPELVAVVGLDALNRHREPAPHLVDEGDGGGDRALRVDLQHAITGGLINGGELIEPTTAHLQVFDVDLDRLAGERQIEEPVHERMHCFCPKAFRQRRGADDVAEGTVTTFRSPSRALRLVRIFSARCFGVYDSGEGAARNPGLGPVSRTRSRTWLRQAAMSRSSRTGARAESRMPGRTSHGAGSPAGTGDTSCGPPASRGRCAESSPLNLQRSRTALSPLRSRAPPRSV